MTSRIVCIDPGHGGTDPGAIGPRGTREKGINLSIAQTLVVFLKTRGIQAFLTRSGDETITLSERVELANRLEAGIFVSIHSNASQSAATQGIETFYHGASVRGSRLADAVQRELIAEFIGHKNLGAKSDSLLYRDGLYVLRNTSMPAIVVETEFLSNPVQEKFLSLPETHLKYAHAIFHGIEKGLVQI